MLGGAIKEAGVLALLNRYYHRHTGIAPLGPDFSVRSAPRTQDALLALAMDHFDPEQMPTIVGVGDTVTSPIDWLEGQPVARRGGSDHNFLQLVQAIGYQYRRENRVVYVDSSQGELSNRKAVLLGFANHQPVLISDPGDERDLDDPLHLDGVLAGGYQQYCEILVAAALDR
ncbi:MAG: hypothetical protein EAZ61_05425 [Oscillatoriales cyanobacterium]|nr:MAG: hypothetical protein EAZ61_05425 [Oscillatoriales cyanobacterium]